jgi:hypothetical protein
MKKPQITQAKSSFVVTKSMLRPNKSEKPGVKALRAARTLGSSNDVAKPTSQDFDRLSSAESK